MCRHMTIGCLVLILLLLLLGNLGIVFPGLLAALSNAREKGHGDLIEEV